MEYIKNIESELKKYKSIDQKNIKLNLKELKKHIKNNNKKIIGKGIGSSCLSKSSKYKITPISPIDELLIKYGNTEFADLPITQTLIRIRNKEKIREHIFFSYQTSEILDIIIYIYKKYYDLHKNSLTTNKNYYRQILSVLYHIFTTLLQIVLYDDKSLNNGLIGFYALYALYIKFIIFAFEELIFINNDKLESKTKGTASISKKSARENRTENKNQELLKYLNPLKILFKYFNDILKHFNVNHTKTLSISELESLFPIAILKSHLEKAKIIDHDIELKFEEQEEMLSRGEEMISRGKELIKSRSRTSRR